MILNLRATPEKDEKEALAKALGSLSPQEGLEVYTVDEPMMLYNQCMESGRGHSVEMIHPLCWRLTLEPLQSN